MTASPVMIGTAQPMSRTLIADIGGSTTRLAVTGADGRPERMVIIAADSVGGLEAAIAAYVGAIEQRPTAAVLAVAGPVVGRDITLTNRDWRFNLDRLGAAFGFARVHALNDFEALAWALPRLSGADLRTIGPDIGVGDGPKVVLGPGTGLGVAALIPQDDGWRALASEGGHMSFGPAAADEVPVFARLADEGPVSAEMAISGRGLERLFHALHPQAGWRGARAIEEAACAGDAAARATVDLFIRLLGRFAGDMALVFKATGGVFVAGGVAHKLAPLFDDDIFRTAFETHPPYQALLKAMPTFLVTCAEPGLLGCAAYAAQWMDGTNG
jgi:glucokinase